MKKIYDRDQFSFERYSDVDIEYRTTQWTFLRAAVFTSWQQHFLKTFSKIPNEILWSASIHLLEAICTEEDLIAIQSTGTVYRTQVLSVSIGHCPMGASMRVSYLRFR
jgi:hypothetical protein